LKKFGISILIIAVIALALCLITKDLIITSSGLGVVIFETLWRVLIVIMALAVGCVIGDIVIKSRKRRKQGQIEIQAKLAAMLPPGETLNAEKVIGELEQYARFDGLKELIEQAKHQVRRIGNRREELNAVSGVIKNKTGQAQASLMTDSFRSIELNLWKSLLLVSNWMKLYAAASISDTGNGERAVVAIRNILGPNDKDISICKEILVRLTEKAITADSQELLLATREAEADLNSLDSSILKTFSFSLGGDFE